MPLSYSLATSLTPTSVLTGLSSVRAIQNHSTYSLTTLTVAIASSRALLDPDELPVTTATLIAINWTFAWKSNSTEDTCRYPPRLARASQLLLTNTSYEPILPSAPPPGSKHGELCR